MTTRSNVLLLALATSWRAAASAEGGFPFPYDWDRFPAAWFGANATSFESEAQLDFIGKFSLAIFGWQHLIFATNWTASVYAQLNQAAILKARHPDLPVFAYTGFGNADGYNAVTFDIIRTASDGCPNHQPCRSVAEPYRDWVLETDSVPVYSMSACEQMGLGYTNPPTDRCWNPIWNVANGSVREFFIKRIIAPLAAAPMIDGVFFDCFNYAYQLPTPWNRKATNVPNCTVPDGGPGCEALLVGTIALARGVASALNAAGKVPIFSNVGTFANPRPGKPFWLDEARLLKGLEGTRFMFNYEFMRAEQVASSGQLPNLLEESSRGVPMGVHTYLNVDKVTNATEDPTPHVAAFMLFRQEHWYYFGSTGWMDGDWPWFDELYGQLGRCGKPLGPARGCPAPEVYSREYERCRVSLNCTDTSKDGCRASIDGPQ
jgi:hypothetical protein